MLNGFERRAHTAEQRAFVESTFDRGYLVERLTAFARISTQVPMGYETYIEPDDPLLVNYVQRVVRPELVRLGYYDLLDVPRNNLVVKVGAGTSGRSLLLQNYVPSQHHNLMADPYSGRVGEPIEYGVNEPAVFGQGITQTKVHQVAMLVVLKLLKDAGVQLSGRLYWAVNSEGRSSHACTNAILDAIGEKPDFSVLQFGTGLRLCLGNRGRADVMVHVRGKAAHSSTPEAGHSAIEGAHEVMTRLRTIKWSDSHPLFGGRHVVVYKVRYEPLAPHTLPSDAYLTVDYRLLPGDDPQRALDEVRAAIGDLSPYEVSVEIGPFMLPALVAADTPGVRVLQDAVRSVRGDPAQTYHHRGTFDAGGGCVRGVPTVMYGATGGVWPLGPDWVTLADAEAEACVFADLVLRHLG